MSKENEESLKEPLIADITMADIRQMDANSSKNPREKVISLKRKKSPVKKTTELDNTTLERYIKASKPSKLKFPSARD